MKPAIFLCSIMAIFLISCTTPQNLVKFNEKPKEVFTNTNLKDFLKRNPQANIVLRIPYSSEYVTSKNTDEKAIVTSNPTMDIYYNAIEKEFLKGGFSVRDRGLFNEVLRKMSRNETENINYSQIKDLTNTDLIVEVIKINPKVEYVTNKTYKVNNKGKVTNFTSAREFKKYGASAEFKIIMVKNNEMAGTYTFNYAPCLEGCPASSFSKPILITKPKAKPTVEPYEGVEVNLMEEFIKSCSRDLINAMKS